MDPRDAWSRAPVLCSALPSEPSLELGGPYGWDDVASERLLGEIDLAATPPAVRLARSYVRELVSDHFLVDRSELADLELLTSEAVTNSVVHAKPRHDGTVLVSVRRLGRHVRVEVTDGGAPRGRPRRPREALAVNGRGLHLIKELATDCGTRHNADGTAMFWFGVAVGEGWTRP